MATAPLEFAGLPTGLTLTATLYPRGSDTSAASGITLTENTNGKGIYRGSTTAALTGWHRALILEGTAVLAIFDILMSDDTTDHYGQDDNIDALHSTARSRTLDVSSGGEAGIDWANVGSPTTTLNLSGTTVKTATDVETDTADIQTRLPAALVSGRMDASLGAIASGVDFSATMKASINTEADAALADVGLTTTITGRIDVAVSTRLATASYTAPLDAAGTRTAVGLASANLDTQLADLPTVAEFEARTIVSANYATASSLSTVAGYIDTEVASILAAVDTEVAAIKAKTDNLPASPAATGDAMTLTSGERDAIAAALLDLANGIESGLTPRNALKLALAVLAGKVTGGGTGTELFKSADVSGGAVQGTTTRLTVTDDSSGNRSAITVSFA